MGRFEIVWDGPNFGTVVATDDTGCAPTGLTLRVTKDSQKAFANSMVELLNFYQWRPWPDQKPVDLDWYVLKVQYPDFSEEEIPGWWAGPDTGWLELPHNDETVVSWRLMAPEKPL